MKRYVLGILLLTSSLCRAARGEMEDPFAQQDILAQKHDDVATAQKEELRKQQEEAAQRARERGRQGEDGSSVVQQGQRGSGPSGQKTSTSTSTAPVNDSAAQALVGQREDSTIIFDVSTLQTEELSKKQQKQLKKVQADFHKTFQALKKYLNPNPKKLPKKPLTEQEINDLLIKVSNYFKELLSQAGGAGKLPKNVHDEFQECLKDVTVLRKKFKRDDQFLKLVSEGFKEHTAGSYRTLSNFLGEERSFFTLQKETEGYDFDFTTSLEDQPQYKAAQKLDEMMSGISGKRTQDNQEKVHDAFTNTFFSRNKLYFNFGFARNNLRKMVEKEPLVLEQIAQDPVLLASLKEHLLDLFPKPTTFSVTYNRQAARYTDRENKTQQMPDVPLRDVIREIKDSTLVNIKDDGSGETNLYRFNLSESSIATKYRDLVMAKMLEEPLQRVKTLEGPNFKETFTQIAEVQIALGARLRDFLNTELSRGITRDQVDRFITNNKEIFEKLKQLSPDTYDSSVRMLKEYVGGTPAMGKISSNDVQSEDRNFFE